MAKLIVFCLLALFGGGVMANDSAPASCLTRWVQKWTADSQKAYNPVTHFNEYLVNNEWSSDLKSNVNAAKKLIQLVAEDQSTVCNTDDKALLEVAKQLAAFEQLTEDNICTFGVDSVSQLADSLRAHGKQPFKSPESRRRLNKIVIEQAEKQLASCFGKLDEEWQEVVRQPRAAQLETLVGQLTTLTDEIVFNRFWLESPPRLNRYAGYLVSHTFKPLDAVPIGIALSKVVLKQTKIKRLKEVDEKTGKLVRTKKTIARHLDRFFWEPCEWLVKQLDEKRANLLERSFKLMYAAELDVDYENYPACLNANLLKWTTNLSTCKRLLTQTQGKDKLVRSIFWLFSMGL